MNTEVFLGLGANLGNPIETLQHTATLIKQIPQIKQFELSHFYKTSPVGNLSQPDFVNAVSRFETSLSLPELWNQLTQIETKLGKLPKAKEAPRFLDIDILFFGQHEINNDGIIIPHLKWKERLFVLIPLSELVSFIQINTRTWNIQELIASLRQSSQVCMRCE